MPPATIVRRSTSSPSVSRLSSGGGGQETRTGRKSIGDNITHKHGVRDTSTVLFKRYQSGEKVTEAANPNLPSADPNPNANPNPNPGPNPNPLRS
jgi:hypothetical protein